MNLRTVFANNFKRVLAASSHSQVELARYLGVSEATVSDWKRGQVMPRINRINQIAAFFQVPSTALIDCTLPPDTEPDDIEETEPATVEHPELASIAPKSDAKQLFVQSFNKLLERERYSLADIARCLGVSAATTSDWKNARIMPSLDNIYRLAELFKVSPNVMLGLEDLPEPKPVKTDILDALFHDSPRILAKLRKVTIDGRLNEPGVAAKLSYRQKERIKDIILLTYNEAVRNGGKAEAYTMPEPDSPADH